MYLLGVLQAVPEDRIFFFFLRGDDVSLNVPYHQINCKYSHVKNYS